MNANQYRTDAPRRPGRRRFLQGGVGLAGAVAAFLIACGGGDKKEEAKSTTTSGGTSGTAVAAASTQTPKKGGKLLEYWSTSTNSLNPVQDYNQGHLLAGVKVYDRLISTRLGK